jgi:hypothetical protein
MKTEEKTTIFIPTVLQLNREKKSILLIPKQTPVSSEMYLKLKNQKQTRFYMQLTSKKDSTACRWRFVLLSVTIIVLASNAGVRQDLQGIATVDSLYRYYERYQTNTYIVRYIVKYLPDFLTQKNVYACPAWVKTVVANGLNSNDDALITESAKVIGFYKLSGYTDRLVELFHQALSQYIGYSTQMRTAIVKALQEIGGAYESIQLISLFNSYPVDLVSQDEFLVLVEILTETQNLSIGETTVSAEKLASIIAFCKGQIAVLNPSKYEENTVRERYLKLVSYLENIRNRLAQDKGGTHE